MGPGGPVGGKAGKITVGRPKGGPASSDIASVDIGTGRPTSWSLLVVHLRAQAIHVQKYPMHLRPPRQGATTGGPNVKIPVHWVLRNTAVTALFARTVPWYDCVTHRC